MKFRHVIFSIPLALALSWSAVSTAQVTIAVQIAPPELPVYDQPPIPGDGYLWTPGYWAWSDDDQDYYWVPGTWVEPPEVGYLWTPGYWGVEGALFGWHPGYWGPQVGFYGGVNYGYGYAGRGYEGGYWRDGHVYYNRAVSNVGSVHVTNVYNKTVINNINVTRVSYNGGNGGVRAAPTPEQENAARDRHIGETPVQRSQEQTARGNPSLRMSANHGAPPIAATPRPGAFSGAGVVTARHGGTMSVVSPQPARGDAQPRGNGGNAESRGNAEYRGNQESRAAAPAQRAPEPRTNEPRANPEPRNVPEQHAPVQRPPEQRAPIQRPPEQQRAQEQRPPEQRAPTQRPPEQQRAPEQREAPRQESRPPPEQHQVTQPRPEAPRQEGRPAPQRPEPRPPTQPQR